MANVSHIKIDDTVLDIAPAVPPSVGNGTLTIQKNGTNVQTFSANQSANATANITVPTKTSELTNDSGYTTNTGTVTQVKVGTTAYDPSSGVVTLPAYPTVNNATLTIQKNGTNVQTFTANQNTNATANITVPTKTSELTNDSGYITNAGVTGVKGNSESTYRTGNVNITKSNIGLGNVPNVNTNNQAPTFTQASTRANIASGETLTTIFGKIMKWFADLKTVAFSGSYADLSNKPTIPTVNNATLTIQKNGTNVQTFTANASSNKTANIIVPTKTSELTNDSNFTTVAALEAWHVGYKAMKTWQASQMTNVSAGSIVAINRNGACTIKFVGVTCTANTALVDASTVIGHDYMYDDNVSGIYIDNGKIFSKNANVGNRILTFANTIG